MTPKKVYFGMVGLICLLILAMAGVAYEVNGLLANKSNSLVALRAKGQALSIEQTSLTQAKKDINTYSGLEQIAKAIVPQDKDQAGAVRQIVNLAAANHIALGSISFPASTLGNAKPGTTSASAAGSQKLGLSQLKPVVGISGVYQLDITIDSDNNSPISYSSFIGFLQGLEQNRRTSQVNSITINPDPNNNALLTFSLTLDEYIKP
ncbi:MAG: hypothetical protein ACREHG_06420 [Candidatus Saccharimonadales bacterium]